MKPEVRDLLRAVVKLAETDLAELTDALVQVDERCARHEARIATLETNLREHFEMHIARLEADALHSVKV